MFAIEAILSDEIRSQNIQTKEVIIAEVFNRKNLSSMISFLNEHISLQEFSLEHLKRVNSKMNKCYIIIAPLAKLSNEEYKEKNIKASLLKYGDLLSDFFLKNGLSCFDVKNVPSALPLTRTQFEKASSLWPVNFHENKHITKCVLGTLFSEIQLKNISELMDETLRLIPSRKNSKQSCNSMSVMIVKNKRTLKVTSVVSKTTRNPLNHPIMIAIDNVASFHRKVKDSPPSEIPEELKHFADDYLCTNYECFLSQDPCLMCAMALVHSRIKRVFIYSDSKGSQCVECNDQAFEKHKLHILDNLNHHYEVWKLSQFCDDEPQPNKKVKL